MRSMLSTSTARTPSRAGPLAAQSREEPEPYSAPAMTMRGVFAARYRIAASKIDIRSPDGRWVVQLPSVPGASWLRSRMFANVPRIITSWLPRRAPYELNSAGDTPSSTR